MGHIKSICDFESFFFFSLNRVLHFLRMIPSPSPGPSSLYTELPRVVSFKVEGGKRVVMEEGGKGKSSRSEMQKVRRRKNSREEETDQGTENKNNDKNKRETRVKRRVDSMNRRTNPNLRSPHTTSLLFLSCSSS